MRFVTAVSLISLLFAGLACGGADGPSDDGRPDETSITGAWVGSGGYLVNIEQGQDDDIDQWQFPDEPLPEIDAEQLCSAPSQGRQFHPRRNIGPEHGSVAWNTRLEADDEAFEMGFNATASTPVNSSNTAWEHHGSDSNTYLVEIYNVDDGPLQLNTAWSVATEVQQNSELGAASVTLDVTTRLFAGAADDCREVTDDHDLFEFELHESVDDIDEQGTRTIEIDADRVVVAVTAGGSVLAQSDEVEGAGDEFRAWLNADYEIVVGD